MNKETFKAKFLEFIKELELYAVDKKKEWKIKGFIDIEKTIFTISTDTKIVSKIIEIHIFPKIAEFAHKNGFILTLPDSQNYYPDLSFEFEKDRSIKYAVDIKTTFTRDGTKNYCGFTLGSHGAYFKDRDSKKNIQYPYKEYKGHFVLGVVYKQLSDVDETKTYNISDLDKIESVINNLKFFFIEKWKIASDGQGSGNTANIGGLLKQESDMINGNGIFESEDEFDDYWMNYNVITIKDKDGSDKTIRKLSDFREYKGKKK
ncbi:MAG: EcoRV family type II restriction endonuclease [Rickettsiales bacterium]|jgi:hypothetical protein|nr:EcoRV family type II restriction endonuclease [Rickettsiales bacterium]